MRVWAPTDTATGCPIVQVDRTEMQWTGVLPGQEKSILVGVMSGCDRGPDLRLAAEWLENPDQRFRAILLVDALAPLEETRMTLAFTHPDQGSGEWTGVLALNTNDPVDPQVVVTLSASSE